MKLTIEIPCNNGIEMEKNLNRAIDDFSEALKKKGFSEMELIAYGESIESEPIYKLNLKRDYCISCGFNKPLNGYGECQDCYNEKFD